MASQIRIGYAGAVYHVMARGNQGRAIYADVRAIAARRLAYHHGEANRAHGVAEAERLLASGLGVLGVEARRLSEMPKGMAKKQVLAWRLRQRTAVGRRWVSEQLRMGEESGVMRAAG